VIEIANDDWELYQDKFGDLISFIAQRITGDPMCCDYEENVQDLYIAAINSINGYYKKNKITTADMAVSEVIKCPLFKQYTKTVLWNAKNQKGNKATKYKNFMPTSIDTLENAEDLVESNSPSVNDPENALDYFHNKFTDEQKEVVAYIVKHPECIRNNGSINYNSVRHGTGKTFYKVKKLLNQVEDKLNGR
jgi:hypothetical protein